MKVSSSASDRTCIGDLVLFQPEPLKRRRRDNGPVSLEQRLRDHSRDAAARETGIWACIAQERARDIQERSPPVITGDLEGASHLYRMSHIRSRADAAGF